jgi:hypothetical protein
MASAGMLRRVALVRTDVSEELATKTRHMERTVREAIEIELHPTISTERVASVSVNHGSLL